MEDDDGVGAEWHNPPHGPLVGDVIVGVHVIGDGQDPPITHGTVHCDGDGSLVANERGGAISATTVAIDAANTRILFILCGFHVANVEAKRERERAVTAASYSLPWMGGLNND